MAEPGGPERRDTDPLVGDRPEACSASQDTVVLGIFERAATFVVPSDVAVTVQSRSPPFIDWESPDRIARLSVERRQAHQLQWAIQTAAPDQIVTPVLYGQVPSGASQELAAQRLIHGEPYTVRLWRWEQGRLSQIAVQDFTY